jgi:hypothetical protein
LRVGQTILEDAEVFRSLAPQLGANLPELHE